ncbi:MAG: AMP-binding protein [Deltaproteobacteria bacterium]|nr:AMP-binding protein [Deltaproteobacteria bacterium]
MIDLARAAREAPDTPALIEAGPGGRRLTYRELAAEVAGVSARLERDDRLRTLVAEPSLETVVELLASLERGQPRLLLSEKLQPAERAELAAHLGAVRPLPAASEPTALVVPTSGSTGRPRGVRLTRAALEAAIGASAAHLRTLPEDVWLCPLPLSHLGGLSIPLRAVAAARPCVLLPRFEVEAFAEAVERERVTLASLVPTLLHRLLSGLPGWRPPSHLRAVLLGGAGVDPATLEAAGEARYPVLPTYGLTETCGQVCTVTPGTPPDASNGAGRPLPGLEVDLTPEGRLRVRGPTLFQGYLPEDGDPPLDTGGWLVTADLGRLDEAGNLHVLGRADQVIVTGGEKVHPHEVEAVLLRHPAIEAAAVVGLPDPEYGQVVAAAVVARPGTSAEALEAHLREHLGGHRRPRRLVQLESLPLTPSGKLDRPALRKLLTEA